MSESKKVAALESVVFNYPAGNNALNKINLDLHQGEIIGLVGANGAGKTTLMKILAGYMDKTDGSILYNGRPIEDFSNKRLHEYVNLVEQNPESQLVGPTVEDELARACRLMGYEGRVIREKVDFVLKLVRMKQAKEWYLDEMSAGERRRIALALALIADPSILLLDEPLSDLDYVGVKDTISTLKELKGRGLCILVSSHRLEDLLELTDRIAVMGEGRLLMVDEPQKVLFNEDILKLATLTLPALPRLFLRLQAEGVLASTKLPLSLDEAVARIKEAVDLRLEATQGLSAMGGSGASGVMGGSDLDQTRVLPAKAVMAAVAAAEASKAAANAAAAGAGEDKAEAKAGDISATAATGGDARKEANASAGSSQDTITSKFTL
jgi:energy-coupling factor transporter ATP-binding protein EcfA2